MASLDAAFRSGQLAESVKGGIKHTRRRVTAEADGGLDGFCNGHTCYGCIRL